MADDGDVDVLFVDDADILRICAARLYSSKSNKDVAYNSISFG